MFSGLNRIQIIGNLGRDPEMRFTPSGTAVTQFSVAVTHRKRRQGTDEWEDETTWFRVVCWDRYAEMVDGMASRGHLKKGTKVYVEGRLQVRNYTDKDGNERTAVEINASDIRILSKSTDGGGGYERDYAQPSEAAVHDDEDDDMDDVPF
ncbi:MAG TPA: single-stranded DNA-binding protein [Thermomicrobiaceae bacterium]|nr:single-stranded DNA-binding protein [Thermomicrobiaceae bacterium]